MNRPDDFADALCFDALGSAVRRSAPPGAMPDAPDAFADDAGVVIHRNNVRSAYLRALQDAFPVVRRLVGDDFFRLLAHSYFASFPPATPLIARYGDLLPEFLDHFEPVGGLPYLSAVARLEIAWLQSYHAPEATLLDAEQINRLADKEADSIRLKLHPSLRLVKSAYPIHEIWLQNRNGEVERRALAPTGEYVLTARPREKVITRTLSLAALLAIEGMLEGLTLGASIERALVAAPASQLTGLLLEVFGMPIVTAAHSGEILRGDRSGD